MTPPLQHTPRVSIGMPVYNGERYLEGTLRTVLAQTFTDFELIIADNASTDDTEAICRDYSQRDSRISYIRNSVNLGASKNYAVCFHPAQGEYFRWSNADDPISSTLVERCVTMLDQNPDAVLTYGKTELIDADGKFLRMYDDNLDLRQDDVVERYIRCHTLIDLSNVLYGLIRRKPLAHTGLLGNYLSSDINLIIELTLYGKFIEISDHLFYRRMHPEASSWDQSDHAKLKKFWDPAKRRFVMQTWRQMYEYLKAVWRAPIRIAEKTAITRFLIKRAYWSKEPLLRELNEFVRYGLLNSK